MQFERGRTLQEHIQKHKGEIRESFIRTVFARLLNGLREVHTHKLLHLDIKPSNVYLRNDGQPVLIDFGAARQTLSIDTPLLKPMYTPGFAAPEQYNNTRRELLGPWTDIYSIGASMYACMAAAAASRWARSSWAKSAALKSNAQSKREGNRSMVIDVFMFVWLIEGRRSLRVLCLSKGLAHHERTRSLSNTTTSSTRHGSP